MFLIRPRTGLKLKKVSKLTETPCSRSAFMGHVTIKNPTYHMDSNYAIKRWTLNNTYEIVSQRSDFNIDTLFVVAYDIQPDNSPPPISREERKKCQPHNKLRIALCSIAMAMYVPLLQLKPSLLRYYYDIYVFLQILPLK